MTRDELVRELERLYAETEDPALFAGSLISYAAHVVRSRGGTCDIWMHATQGAFDMAVKTWEKYKLLPSARATDWVGVRRTMDAEIQAMKGDKP